MREADSIKAIAQLLYAGQLPTHLLHLVIDIAKEAGALIRADIVCQADEVHKHARERVAQLVGERLHPLRIGAVTKPVPDDDGVEALRGGKDGWRSLCDAEARQDRPQERKHGDLRHLR